MKSIFIQLQCHVIISYGIAGRRLYLRRNENNRGLCPVIAIMMWLSILRYNNNHYNIIMFKCNNIAM